MNSQPNLVQEKTHGVHTPASARLRGQKPLLVDLKGVTLLRIAPEG
jgi:hypothetical protein